MLYILSYLFFHKIVIDLIALITMHIVNFYLER